MHTEEGRGREQEGSPSAPVRDMSPCPGPPPPRGILVSTITTGLAGWRSLLDAGEEQPRVVQDLW